MTEQRPLPDSEEMENRRLNERFIRWVTAVMIVILASLVVLLALGRILQG